jgi:rhamnogalacturonan endolyase
MINPIPRSKQRAFAILLVCLLVCLVITTSCRDYTKIEESQKELIFYDDFTKLDTLIWHKEIDPQPYSDVYVRDGKLILDTKGGVTVWLDKLFSGNIQIEYTRKVLMEGNENDRLSDFNQFWMALDPAQENLFTRSGKFEEYDSLQLYYVGVGGNWNETTRFRKYHNGTRRLIQEYTDKDHLLEGNKSYQVKTIVKDGVTSFWVDGECYFNYSDTAALKEGYFGFRSTKSRQEISNFKVYQLK